MYFDKELTFLRNNENPQRDCSIRRTIPNSELDSIRNAYPNVPVDFLHYLSEIGAGSIRESQFKVFSNLCDVRDLGLDEMYEMPESIKLFGDNFSGDFSGFDLSSSGDEVVEFWHDSTKVFKTGKTFREYIREKILMK